MNYAHMLTIALATVPTMLTVLVGILINNARVNDVNSQLAELRSHMDAASMMSTAASMALNATSDEMKEMRRSARR